MIAILLYRDEGPKAKLFEIADFLRQELSNVWVGFANEAHSAPTFEYDHIDGIRYLSKPGIFQQVNRAANALVLASVQRHLKEALPARVLDLCCGSGNLSLQAAKEGVQVTGVESNPLSIAVAKENLKENFITSAEYFAQDSLRFLHNLKKESYDLILIDPPREGLKEGMNDLKRSGAKQLIYLSCDPATLARDIAMLAPVYQVKKAEAYDFFPHTWHVETLLFLEKS
jgi:23S rRNA (uracil1939-C5)-methyltransferase